MNIREIKLGIEVNLKNPHYGYTRCIVGVVESGLFRFRSLWVNLVRLIGF